MRFGPAVMKKAADYFRANPQVFILLVICLVLGLGSFLAIVISLATQGGQNTGQPEGLVRTLHAGVVSARLAISA